LIFTYEIYLNAAQQLRAEQWVIDTYAAILAELKASQKENRAMTGAFPACTVRRQFARSPPCYL
jgi:hypothetical protein